MIQDHPSSQQPTWRLVTQEALAYGAAGVLFPFGTRASRTRTPRRREQRSVVLVHGYLANRSALLPLGAYLRWRGLEPVLTFNYRSGRGVPASARALRDFLREHVRGGRIDLVGHSMGGLVARFYLQELGGARRVDRCITLGTPHEGTYNSYWLWTRVGSELRPDSALLNRLRASRAQAANVRFLSLVAGSDNLVIPRVFARHQAEVCLPDLGHIGMLFSPRVFRIVGDALLAPRSAEA